MTSKRVSHSAKDHCLIVFDLDLTLWHCGSAIWIEMLSSPLKLRNDGKIVDKRNQTVHFWPDVHEIITEIKKEYVMHRDLYWISYRTQVQSKMERP
jgi:predicted phosphatase